MEFDKLISNGQLTKAARLFAKEYYDSGRMGHTRRLLIERLADKCDKYDAEIARQSVTSEEVAISKTETTSWTMIDSDINLWKCSKCSEEWNFEFGGPTENNMHYCPACGRRLED